MQKQFKTIIGTYYNAVETLEFNYYVNYKESDENASVIMFNKQGEVISDNYHAYCSLFETLENKSYTRISRTISKLFNNHIKQYNDES